MSYEAVKWAMDDAPMLLTPAGKPDSTARYVLAARAERASADGTDTHAAITDVMWRTGYDERTVRRAERRLEAAGLMVPAGMTHWGTPRWNLDMSKVRTAEERAAFEAAYEAEKLAEAARKRVFRATKKAAPEGPPADVEESARPDSNSGRPDSKSGRPDANSAASGRSAPLTTLEPPGNHPEPPSGGTLPPDPLRPGAPAEHRNESETFLSSGEQEPPRPSTATHDRARETPPAPAFDEPAEEDSPLLTLIKGGIDDPKPATPTGKGFGFCLACHANGQMTLAVDTVTGDACASHLRGTA